ncbi:hypothetical protein I7I53_07765 [Histoplasma capsulatum var. duboisii H88]|uniref:Uncharacterized protein n=1 Tax=Ajellomyces capsulatus (strain H88) TaxID=544711 RepID=A0A8A1LEE5_AJEC8|nr:hypothetical protein I7I53_07765 [Histoplasma capsulatum var. duboisii H88]
MGSSEKSNSWSDSGGTLTEGESNRIHLSQLMSLRSEMADGRAEKSAKTSFAAFLKRSSDAEKRGIDTGMGIGRRCWCTSSDQRSEVYAPRRCSVS